MEIIKIVILSLSALLLLFVGSSRLSKPIKTYQKNSGIKIDNEVNLLNEMRGVSALMLCGISGLCVFGLTARRHLHPVGVICAIAVVSLSPHLIQRAADFKQYSSDS